MAVARLALTSFADGEVRLSDEVELYQRTYTTLLRSSGETQLRVLEPSHWRWARACIRSPPARSSTSARSCTRSSRLPDGIVGAELVVMGQDVEALTANGIPVDSWEEAEAPARRRRWYDSGDGHARGAAGERLGRRRPRADAGRVPDRVEQDPRAHARRGLAGRAARPTSRPRSARASSAAAPRTGRRLRDGLGRDVRRADATDRRASGCRCGCGCSAARNTGYARLTRRWWAPVSAELASRGSPSVRCTSSAPTPTASSTSSPASPASASPS